MNLPSRKFSAGSSYRYGFNGKENDTEVYGEGKAYDFGARIQDSRLGRFLSIDPMTVISPQESPYLFAGNSPLALSDFDGLFKISPYFVKKYPTLAKILKYVLPTFINNIEARDGWIRANGFDDKNKGITAWEEMLTYGKGPWITPTLSKEELLKNGGMEGLSLYLSRFGGGNEWENDSYPNNISFSSWVLHDLESALKSGNDEETVFNSLKAMILIMHESGHWTRSMKAGKENRTGGAYEDGALVEEWALGKRFSYTDHCPPNTKCNDVSAIRDDLIKTAANGIRTSMNFLFGKNAVSNLLRMAKTPEGQTGDPVLKGAKINEGKIFTTPSSNKTGNSGSAKNGDYTY